MEENKFEKQVQMKMEDLKFQPSDAVWKKIESQIRKKKESRRILFILFFAAIIMGAAFLFSSQSAQNLSIIHNAAIMKAGVNKINMNPLAENTKQKGKEKSDSLKEHLLMTNNIIANHSNSLQGAGSNVSSQKTKLANIFSDKKMLLGNNNSQIVGTIISFEQKQNNSENHTDTNSKLLAAITNPKENKEKTLGINDPVNKDTSIDSSGSANKILKVDSKIDSSHKKTIGNKKTLTRTKWQIGLVGSEGISGTGHNITSFRNTYTNPNAYSSGISSSSLPPLSLSKPSVAFSLGLFFQEHLSKAFNLHFGLTYKSYTTSINVGVHSDSSRGYLTPDYQSSSSATTVYKNHYNFLEAPIGFTFSFFNSKNVPLSFEGDLDFSKLLTSNSLQFNQSTGVYTVNNSFFNNMLIGISTGVQALFFKNYKHPLSIGPFISYDLSGMAKDGVYINQHYIAAVIRASILLKK